MNDFVGVDNHGNALNHVSDQHVDFSNNNKIVIDGPVAREIVDESNIPFRRSTRQRYPSPRYSPNQYVLLYQWGRTWMLWRGYGIWAQGLIDWSHARSDEVSASEQQLYVSKITLGNESFL